MRRRFFFSMLAVAGLVLAVIATASAAASRNNQTRQTLLTQAERVAALVSDRLDQTTLARLATDERIRQILDDAAAAGTTVGVGRFSAANVTFAPQSPFVPLEGLLAPTRLSSGQTQYLTVRTDNGLVSVGAYPIVTDSPTNWVVVAAAPLPRVPLGQILRELAAPMLVAAVVAFIAAQLLARWLAGKLEALSIAAEAVAGGDTTVRVAVEGGDELATLAESFNSMAADLTAARDRERGFLMSVGHDLRTPLTTIGGYAEALEEGAVDDPAAVGRVMTRETNRLRRLVEDVMLLARLEADQFTIHHEPVDVGAHIGEVAESFRSRAEAAGLVYDVELSETGDVSTDPDRVAQLMANLIENALRFTPEAGAVHVGVLSDDRTVTFEVTDTGPGMEPDDLRHVFERFAVGRRSTVHRPEGSGLGLAIVKQLADRLGGRVEAESRPGQGSTFRFVLDRRIDTMP